VITSLLCPMPVIKIRRSIVRNECGPDRTYFSFFGTIARLPCSATQKFSQKRIPSGNDCPVTKYSSNLEVSHGTFPHWQKHPVQIAGSGNDTHVPVYLNHSRDVVISMCPLFKSRNISQPALIRTTSAGTCLIGWSLESREWVTTLGRLPRTRRKGSADWYRIQCQ
jgi:hypothetical protein